MTILLVAAGAAVLGWLLDDGYYGGWGVLAVCSAAVLVALVVTLPITHYSVHSQVARFHAVEVTAVAAREDGDGLEGAAFRAEIADANAWLASEQYWNGTLFDLWVPDVVDTLEPIR